MENIVVVLVLVIGALAFYIYHRGVAGAKTDADNATASIKSDIANLQTHVQEVKAAVQPTTVAAPVQPPAPPAA